MRPSAADCVIALFTSSEQRITPTTHGDRSALFVDVSEIEAAEAPNDAMWDSIEPEKKSAGTTPSLRGFSLISTTLVHSLRPEHSSK